jgi:hypothetical protein
VALGAEKSAPQRGHFTLRPAGIVIAILKVARQPGHVIFLLDTAQVLCRFPQGMPSREGIVRRYVAAVEERGRQEVHEQIVVSRLSKHSTDG